MVKRKRGSDRSDDDESDKKAMKSRQVPKRHETLKKVTASNDKPPRASLLGMPGEIRNDIFRFSVLEPTGIDVNRAGSQLEPALLRCCLAVRKEARPIFCQENIFHVTVSNCRMTENARHWIWMGDDVPYKNVHIRETGKPSWSALKEWIKFYKYARALGIPDDDPACGTSSRVVSRAFAVAEALGNAPWEEIEAALGHFRQAVDLVGGTSIFDD